MSELIYLLRGHDFLMEWAIHRSARCGRCGQRARHVTAPWPVIRFNVTPIVVREEAAL